MCGVRPGWRGQTCLMTANMTAGKLLTRRLRSWVTVKLLPSRSCTSWPLSISEAKRSNFSSLRSDCQGGTNFTADLSNDNKDNKMRLHFPPVSLSDLQVFTAVDPHQLKLSFTDRQTWTMTSRSSLLRLTLTGSSGWWVSPVFLCHQHQKVPKSHIGLRSKPTVHTQSFGLAPTKWEETSPQRRLAPRRGWTSLTPTNMQKVSRPANIGSETPPWNLCHHTGFAGSKKERDVFHYASTRGYSRVDDEDEMEEEEHEEEEEVEDTGDAGMEENTNSISTADKLFVEFREVRCKLSWNKTNKFPYCLLSFYWKVNSCCGSLAFRCWF